MTQGNLYKSLADYYEFITTGKGHKEEAEFIRKIVKKYKKSKGNALLDVGCGHGWHDKFLKKHFRIIGIDFSNTILKLAKKRNSEVMYKQEDMKNFDLKKKFDVVMCFDAMAHNLNYADLKSTIKCLSKHLTDGGVLIFHLDKLRENFKQYEIVDFSQHKKKNTQLTFFQINYDKNPSDMVFETCLVFLITEKGEDLQVKIDKEKLGLFEASKIKEILSDIGFKIHLYSGDFTGKEYSKKSPFPVFVCVK
jgi:SAM-dependent methyltransferase